MRLPAAAVLLLLSLPACTHAQERPSAPPRAPAPAGYAYVQNVSATRAVVAYAEGRTVTTATLTGLAPDTEYPYEARSADGAVKGVGKLRTAPLPGRRTVVFGAVGDSGSGRPEQVAVARAMAASTPALELVVHTGDVVYPSGEWERYAPAVLAPYAALMARIPFFFSMGNHDSYTENGAPFDAMYVHPANNPEGSERYYSFDWGDVHFTALDVVTTPFAAGTPQRTFLERDLAAATAPWKVVFFHYPALSDGAHGDTGAVKAELAPVFEARGVDVVLQGHDHDYQRLKPVNGVTYMVTGGGGASLRALAPTARVAFGTSRHHFLRGRADGRTLAVEAIDAAGTVFDMLTLSK